MPQLALKDFLNRVESTYRSIDLRVAAVRTQGEWFNALTVIRFSYLEHSEVTKQQESLELKYGVVDTDRFKIKMDALPYGALQYLWTQFASGAPVHLRDGEIRLGPSRDLLSLHGQLNGSAYTRRDNSQWPCFELFEGGRHPLLNDEQLQGEVKSATNMDFNDSIAELLEINYSSNLSLDLVINAPFYAAVDNVDFSGQKAEVQVKFHKDLQDLSIGVVVRKSNSGYSPIREKVSSPIEIQEKSEQDQHITHWKKSFDLLNTAPTDYLSWNLMQTKPTALDIDRPSFSTQVSTYSSGRKQMTTPLLAAFGKFCNLDELEACLINPSEITPLLRNQKMSIMAANFELAVTWLLGTCGFSLVWLGESRHENFKESSASRFTVDILAQHAANKNLLVLVGCTSSTPNDKDVDNLKSVRKILQDSLFGNTQTVIKPIIFSAAPELGNKERDGVKLLDSGDIRGILNNLRKGDVKRALNEAFGYDLGFSLDTGVGV